MPGSLLPTALEVLPIRLPAASSTRARALPPGAGHFLPGAPPLPVSQACRSVQFRLAPPGTASPKAVSPSVRPSICPQSCRSLSPAPQAVPPPSPHPFPLGQGRPKPWQEGAGPGAVAAAGKAVPRQVQHLPPRKEYDCSAPAAEPVRLPSRHTRTGGRFKCPFRCLGVRAGVPRRSGRLLLGASPSTASAQRPWG